jgi:hypothetical protein
MNMAILPAQPRSPKTMALGKPYKALWEGCKTYVKTTPVREYTETEILARAQELFDSTLPKWAGMKLEYCLSPITAPYFIAWAKRTLEL